MKWIMIDASLFVANHEEYTVDVYPSMGRWTWRIKRNGVAVDSGYRYSPCTSELDAKVKAEKALNNLLSQRIAQQ